MSPAVVVEGPSPGLKPRPALRRQKTREVFQAASSLTNRMEVDKNNIGSALQVLYLGIAIASNPKVPGELLVGISGHDGTYSIDYAMYAYTKPGSKSRSAANSEAGSGTATPASATSYASSVPQEDTLEDFVIARVTENSATFFYKFVGGGITEEADKLCPDLAARLWKELDIVMYVLSPFDDHEDGHKATDCEFSKWVIDEESDSVVRKAVRYFGASNQPRLQLNHRNVVGVDGGGKAHIATRQMFEDSVHPNTWNASMQYATSLKTNKTKIAFFNSTPQGGGVALMRHALIRFLRLVGVDCKWYVPRPKPEVFRITKNNHNLLQGVAEKDIKLDENSIKMLDDWCLQNAERVWINNKGPLAARSEGGADVIIIDDPQMPMLVDIAKQHDPERPVIFRSHIQVRADLADNPDEPASTVWNWIWNHVKKCDVFVSHPVPHFVPKNVTPEKVGYMPATTDWLDGLNKHMSNFDLQYYMHEFKVECMRRDMRTLDFPVRKYIVQIARFDPAKGIPDVLAAYAKLREDYMQDTPLVDIPQLVIAGHGAIDDPDASIVFNETLLSIRTTYAAYESDIIVLRVGPTDQLLNAVMHNAHVALQLSTREGFEVKVSEALKHGVPIIATRTGGIPLQVQHEKSGFLVDSGDVQTVAKYLFHLFTQDGAYEDMALFAASNVSDEVSTVGNALSWLYLADTLAKGEAVVPEKKWVNDMARERVGVAYEEDETRLPRGEELALGI